MSWANLTGVPTQTAGSSPVIASDWNTYVRDNISDLKFGHFVCTSSTRPSTSLSEGIMIYETDTNKVMMYNGTGWVELHDLDTSGTLPDGFLSVSAGSFGRSASVTKTASFSVGTTENWIICNSSTTITVTLPSASTYAGREIMIKNINTGSVVSIASDVIPMLGGSAGTAILPAGYAGAYATLVSNGTSWVVSESNVPANIPYYIPTGITLYYTTAGANTFTKATYPWLRALRVRMVGAGGGGGYSGTVNNYAGSGGGGGAYAEKFVTDIAGLAASETVTVGNNGSGGTSTANGTTGGASSAFSVTANGGAGGTDPVGAIAGVGGTATGGDINIPGQAGFAGGYSGASAATHRFGQGGSSLLGFGSKGASAGQGTGTGGSLYGGGGGGGYRINTSYNGGAGADGIVIVDLFA